MDKKYLKKENYLYDINIPKNIKNIKLTPQYDYNYALYKKENKNQTITSQTEKKWAGVI